MNESEFPGEQLTTQEKINEITYRASDMKEFIEIVKNAKSKVEAIKNIRISLGKYFLGISDIPKEKFEASERQIEGTGLSIETETRQGIMPRIIVPPLSPDFKIANQIVELLWEK